MVSSLERSSSGCATVSRFGRSGAKGAWLAVPFLLGAVLSAASCASSPPSTQHAQAEASDCPHAHGSSCGPKGSGAMMEGGMMEASCPMKVPGTSMHAVDVEGGAALEFSTTGDVAEVRRRVAHMADMHNHGGMMHGEGMMGGGMADGGMMEGKGMMGGGMMHGGMMHADARAEDMPQGARLIFTPKDPKELEALRAETKEHAEHGCPMMSMH